MGLVSVSVYILIRIIRSKYSFTSNVIDCFSLPFRIGLLT